MTKEIFLPKWAQTGENHGDSLTDLVLGILSDHQVEFTPTCEDSPCLPSPNETLRQGITTLAALVQALNARLTLPTYANNAAAVLGGLAVGAFYKTDAGNVHIVV